MATKPSGGADFWVMHVQLLVITDQLDSAEWTLLGIFKLLVSCLDLNFMLCPKVKVKIEIVFHLYCQVKLTCELYDHFLKTPQICAFINVCGLWLAVVVKQLEQHRWSAISVEAVCSSLQAVCTNRNQLSNAVSFEIKYLSFKIWINAVVWINAVLK